MSSPEMLDQAFHVIMQKIATTGRAPFYIELASELGVSPEQGRKIQKDLFSAGIAGWLYPDTDHIASFAPFNNQPTQYRIRIEGEQKWYGQ
jgi:hypothetical protein